MSNNVLTQPVRSVLASTAWNDADVQTSRVNVVGGDPATLVKSTRGEKTSYALYDDFGQLKATLPQSYETIPTLAFVGGEALPGANGVTVEIRDDAKLTEFEQMKQDLYEQMRPGFAEEMDRAMPFSMPIVRDYGVMRNLANLLLEKYSHTLSPSEATALDQFSQKCAEKAAGWSFSNDPYKLLPSTPTTFASLASPVDGPTA